MLFRSGSATLVQPRKIRRRANIPRILLVGTGVGACVWGATWLVTAIGGAIPTIHAKITNPAPAQNPTITKKINHLPPAPKPTPAAVSPGALTTDIAQQTVKSWLSAKTKSLDRGYQIDKLKDILVEPALASAIARSKSAQGSQIHWQYQHQNIAVSSIAQTSPAANIATITAQVDEKAQYYEGDRLDPGSSYSKQLVVEYNLVRQQDRWYVKAMRVVN